MLLFDAEIRFKMNKFENRNKKLVEKYFFIFLYTEMVHDIRAFRLVFFVM